MELRRAQYTYWNWAREHRPLVGDFRRHVAGGEPVAPDDGHHDHPLHAGPLADLLQIPGGGGEERRGRLLLGRGPARHVDDALHASQGVRQTLPRDEVHAGRARYRDDVVSPCFEYVDDMTTDPSGRPCYRNPSACLHDSSSRDFQGLVCSTAAWFELLT